MADFSDIKLNTIWPPGKINYPEKVNGFIDYNEDTSTELENSRGGEANLYNYLLAYIIHNNLRQDILSSSTQFSNMPNAIDNQDYVTKQDAINKLGEFTATDSNFNGTFTEEFSEFIVLNDTDFTVFSNQPSSLSTYSGLYLYPSSYNKTYYLDWSSTGLYIELNRPIGTIPTVKAGDRLRFILTNSAASDYIQSQNLINGVSTVTMGDTYNHVIIDLSYVNTYGWFIKNLITG